MSITEGSAFLFQALDFVLQQVGEVVRRQFDASEEDRCGISPIHALVITDNQGLVPHIRFSLPGNRVLIILLEYESVTIRCARCLSYNHFLENCNVLFPIEGRSHSHQPTQSPIRPTTSPPHPALLSPINHPSLARASERYASQCDRDQEEANYVHSIELQISARVEWLV